MNTKAFTNQKNEVGKTSSAFALAEVLNGAYSQEMLLIDVDPQASLTYTGGVGPNITMADVLLGGKSEFHELMRIG